MGKKILRVFICVAMLAGVMTGCGGSTSSSTGGSGDSGGETKLTLWYWNRSLDDEIIRKAEKEFNVTIDNQKIADDYTAKVISTLAGGQSLPDILCFNSNVARYLDHADKFVNLLEEPYNAGEIADQYLDWKLNLAMTADKKTLIALPIDIGPTALFYRADIFEKIGLPSEPDEVSEEIATWEDWIEAGKKAKEAGYLMTDNIEEGLFGQVLAQGDKLLYDERDNFIGEQEHIKKMWNIAIDAHEAGISAATARWTVEWNAVMNDSSVISYVGAVWMKQPLIEGAVDTAGKWRVTKAPGGAGNHGGSFIGLSADGKHKEKSWEVIKWMMNDENQKTALKTMNLFPASVNALQDTSIFTESEFFGNQKTDEVFAKIAENVPLSYYGPHQEDARTIYQEELKAVESGDKTPEEAWNSAIERCKTEINR